MSKLIQKAYFSDNIKKRRPHYHDCHQIILITKGNVEFCINDRVYSAGKGNIIIFSRYENHSVNIASESYERYVLHISPKIISIENRVYSLLLNRPEGFCNAVDIKDDLPVFEEQFRRIVKEFCVEDKLSDNMQQLLINQLLIMLCRKLPSADYFYDESSEMIYALQRRFETDFNKQYSLCELAKEHNVSVSTLSHKFKKLTGTSVMDYLVACRMAMAKNYLTGTDLSVGEIVEKCGFSDSSNFSRTFLKLNGMSPTAFRKKCKAE